MMSIWRIRVFEVRMSVSWRSISARLVANRCTFDVAEVIDFRICVRTGIFDLGAYLRFLLHSPERHLIQRGPARSQVSSVLM